MAYNPAYNKPTWASEEVATSTKLNQMVDNTEHNHIYKPELPPNAPTNPTVKMAVGRKQFTFTSASQYVDVTVTFATDSAWGDPGFANAPYIQATLEEGLSASGIAAAVIVRSRSATQVVFRVAHPPGESFSSDVTMYLHWQATGN